jgi:hypothetical protein
MSGFVKGLLIGLSVAGLMATYSYGDMGSNHENEERHIVSEFQVTPEMTNCQVSVGYGRTETSGRCWSGDVVTGVDGDTLRCSSIYVRCY